MAGPFYNLIKGTTAGAPGTGAFTPNAASAGFRAWTNVPTGWWGMVRFEDGSDWELAYSYWNGTTLSRAATQDVSSSTGSLLTLTAAAQASLVADGARITPFHSVPWRGIVPIPAATTTPTAIGLAAATVTGTAAAASIAATNFLTRQPRSQSNSVTTANGQAGYSHTTAFAMVSTTAGAGGYMFHTRFGAATLPTGPRLFIGMTQVTFVANVGEPSAFVAAYATFSKDSTDTNIQLLTNSNAGAGTKVDTGIALVANSWYEAVIWSDPGSLTVKALLVRIDTGAIWYGETATDVPLSDSTLFPQTIGGLSATTGTAFGFCTGGYGIRSGAW